ncbi:MAG: methyltransferase domain-containing protein [Chitinophagaceae bacterium]|nr:methyltransferase domain-containing protein [Chitinophagaceae bacterium]MBP8243308.1 methyltransferase domain-containing protein [Chitinophagaceae bacterium]
MKFSIRQLFRQARVKKPAEGYDTWAGSYDDQPHNLILHLDREILNNMLQDVTILNRKLADIGCGTGRHWTELYKRNPVSITGFDVSTGMLEKLKLKFPEAPVFLVKDHELSGIATNQFDFLLSTLTLAHIKNARKALEEWNRVLQSRGELILTDYHPDALQRNASRTFHHQGKTYAVQSHVHPVEQIRQIAGQLGWTEIRYTERKIDESVKDFYLQQGAEALYQQYQGMPLIYGIHFKKQ